MVAFMNLPIAGKRLFLCTAKHKHRSESEDNLHDILVTLQYSFFFPSVSSANEIILSATDLLDSRPTGEEIQLDYGVARESSVSHRTTIGEDQSSPFQGWFSPTNPYLTTPHLQDKGK